MQEDFSGWYASMSFGEDAKQSDGRWKALQAVVDGASKPTIEMLVRLAFRTKVQMSAPEVADLRSKFAGELAPPGDEELVMLAASALAWAMKTGNGSSAFAATMVATASCGGLRMLKQPMDLIDMSARATRLHAETSRQRPSLDVGKPLSTSLDKADVESILKLANDGNPQGAIQAVVTSINKALAAVAKRQRAVEAEFQKYTMVQDEELDVLWWLQGAHCSDLEKDFLEVSPELRPLAIARELASLTKALPGPTAVPALLSRAGVAEAPKLSIAAAVQGMPAGWLDKALSDIEDNQISPVTTPILFALSRRKELDGATGWESAWSKLASLDQVTELEPLRFAEAAYREFLLAQFV